MSLAVQEWPHESAGRHMTQKVPTCRSGQTVAEIRAMIETNIKDFETINYVYVLEDSGKLIGIISLKEIFSRPAHIKAGRICRRKDLATIKPWKHQERVAYLALKHNIKAVPVVDGRHKFLGVIPSDTILHILYKETHEDLMRRAGIHSGHPPFDNILTMSLWQSFKHRLPWLFIGLVGGILAAKIIGVFEETLAQNLILAAFIPLIVYMSDAVGTQMEAFIIRDLAVDRHLPFLRYVFKQFVLVVVLAFFFSIILFAAGSYLYATPYIGIVLGASLFGAICSSMFTGLLIPYGFHKLKMDPANASGPVATVIQDILSIVIYFSIASYLL